MIYVSQKLKYKSCKQEKLLYRYIHRHHLPRNEEGKRNIDFLVDEEATATIMIALSGLSPKLLYHTLFLLSIKRRYK